MYSTVYLYQWHQGRWDKDKSLWFPVSPVKLLVYAYSSGLRVYLEAGTPRPATGIQ